MATSALAELGFRDQKQAEMIAWKILSEHKGDSHLQSLALEIMFDCNAEKTIQFIQTHWQTMNSILLKSVEDIIRENNCIQLEQFNTFN